MPISQYQFLFPRGPSGEDARIIHSQNGQTSSLAIRRRSQRLTLNSIKHDGVKVLLRWDSPDRPGPRLGIYDPWTLSTAWSRPNTYICRIGITYLARCLRLLNGHAQITWHISHAHKNGGFDERRQDQSQWDFYNVYPQVMSILREEAVECHKTLPSRCCQEYVDEQEDIDNRSINDSGIDLNEEHRVASGNASHDNAKCEHSEGAPRYRWSVDETIALHLLEAMESRQGDVNRITKKKRKGHKLLRRIVLLFREIRTRYLS